MSFWRLLEVISHRATLVASLLSKLDYEMSGDGATADIKNPLVQEREAPAHTNCCSAKPDAVVIMTTNTQRAPTVGICS